MPNIKSAKKRVLVNEKKHARNAATATATKTKIKKAKAAIEADDKNSQALVNDAFSAIDKTAGKNIISKNSASRKKASLARAAAANTKK